ncbi:MAG: hypothetical protein ACPLY9_02815 [Nitrososphaerales archaeon]
MLSKLWTKKEAFKYYKDLGDLFKSAEKYFIAADFYEHAAEIMIKEGMNPSKHVNPKEIWIKNAKYLEEKGEIDDIEWSLRRASKYTELINELVKSKRQKVHRRPTESILSRILSKFFLLICYEVFV